MSIKKLKMSQKRLNTELMIATAESILHVELEQEAAKKADKQQMIILCLTSGNQFGMSEADILSILANQAKYPNLDIYGIHYYSGTQKKKRQIDKDFEKLDVALTRSRRKLDLCRD